MSASKPLKHYFDREWKRLQTEGKSFAKAFPEQAGYLHWDAPSGRDPNIDHLLQGCTFLSAQIHRYIDQTANAVPEQWLRQWWPQFVQEVPSFSVSQFKMTAFTGAPVMVPIHTPLLSKPVGTEQVRCRFETQSPLVVHSFDIASVTLNDQRQVLSIQCQALFDRAVSLSSMNALTFYLSDENAQACQLYRMLRQQLDRVVLCFDDKEVTVSLSFPSQSLPASGLMGHQSLFDYFSFPQRFLFFTVSGFDNPQLSQAVKSFSLKFCFNKAMPAAVVVDKQSFLMNAVLIANAFNMSCEPIDIDGKRERFAIYPDRNHPDAYRILSVLSAQGMSDYSVERDSNDLDQSYIYAFNTDKALLSVDATVSNGFYPHRHVPVNGLTLNQSPLDKMCVVHNVLAPTMPLSPPDVSTALIECLMMQRSDFFQVDSLKRVFRALNWTQDPQHAKRVEGILSVHVNATNKIMCGAFVRVLEISLTVDHAAFVSNADIFFFGDILNIFFKAQAGMHQSVSLTINVFPHNERFTWNG